MNKLLAYLGLYTITSHPDAQLLIERLRAKGHDIYPPMDMTATTNDGEIVAYQGRWLRAIHAGEQLTFTTLPGIIPKVSERGVVEILPPLTAEEFEFMQKHGDDAEKMKQVTSIEY